MSRILDHVPEEASRWSRSLSASALQHDPIKRPPNMSVAGSTDREGEDSFKWAILARTSIRTGLRRSASARPTPGPAVGDGA